MMASVFITGRRGRFEMQRRPCGCGGKDASDVARSQGPPGTTHPPEAGECPLLDVGGIVALLIP